MAGENGTVTEAVQISSLDGKPPESTDFANYFCTYGYLYHQKDMLEDHKRTGAYFAAVLNNRAQFEGKVVLDVGTGSGILAIFAAQAGARRVYAVEATGMAKFAKLLTQHNQFGDVVEVIQGTVETVELPEQVDIIISEWMGYFLLRESMLDSVIVARDRFLKPGGALYPSHARMFLAPIRTNLTSQRGNEFQNSMAGWQDFIADMQQFYGVNLDCLSKDFASEQMQYYMHTAQWSEVHPLQLNGPPVAFASFDLHTITLDDLKKVIDVEFTMPIATQTSNVDGFAGFFDVDFKGSKENPTDFPVKLSTAPDATGATHWGQMTFLLSPSVPCVAGDKLKCKIKVARREDNHRLLRVVLDLTPEGSETFTKMVQKFGTLQYNID